jgi:hypothetical protein
MFDVFLKILKNIKNVVLTAFTSDIMFCLVVLLIPG